MTYRTAYRPYYVSHRGVQYHSWQNGTGKDDMISAAAAAENDSVVVVGYHRDFDGFLAAKLDGDGTPLWQWEVSYLLSLYMWRTTREVKRANASVLP